MAEPIGPLFKIKDKATALEVERLLEMAQRQFGPDRLELPGVSRAIGQHLKAFEVPFFYDFITGQTSAAAARIKIWAGVGYGEPWPAVDQYILDVRRGTLSSPSVEAIFFGADDDRCVVLVSQSGSGGAIAGSSDGSYAVYGWVHGASAGKCFQCDNDTGSTGHDIYGTDGVWYARPTGAIHLHGISLFYSGETIASGAITIDEDQSEIEIHTEGGAASDDLDTISGGVAAQIVILTGNGDGDTVNVIEGGNLYLGASPRILTCQQDQLVLIKQGTWWNEISYSNNA